jgi:hypothetical protein
MLLGVAWKWGLPGFLLSAPDPNAFREIAKSQRLGADAETEVGASARQLRFEDTFSRCRPILLEVTPFCFLKRKLRDLSKSRGAGILHSGGCSRRV